MTIQKHWHAGQTDDSNVHVWPCQDAITHQPNDDCPCLPQIRLQQSDEGDLWIYTHQAADGRPFIPPAEQEENGGGVVPWYLRIWFPLPVPVLVGVVIGAAGYLLGRRRKPKRRLRWQ